VSRNPHYVIGLVSYGRVRS